MSFGNLDSYLINYGPEELELFSEYTMGRCSPAAKEIVKQHMAEDAELADLLRRIRRARLVTEAAGELWDLDAVRKRLDERRLSLSAWAEGKTISIASAAVRRSRFVRLFRIAAAVVALAGGTILWQNRGALLEQRELVLRIFETGVGERMRITLDDETEIVLGPVSTLKFAEPFGSDREIQLEGEAVFDVTSDGGRSFRVLTELGAAEVLGTRFGVRSYTSDGYLEVVVAKGRVAVSSQGERTYLARDQAVRVGADGIASGPRAVNASLHLSWTEGHMVFDRTPLTEVARVIERRYGVILEWTDPAMAELRLTAEFLQPGRVAEVVRLISLSLGVEYEQTASGYLLLPTT